MDETAIDRAGDALDLLEAITIIHEAGRTDIIEAIGDYELDRDDEYGLALEGLSLVCDCMHENDNENSDMASIYFSSKDMMEYYRICRDYCKAKGCSLKNNPYIHRAARFVASEMYEPECYYVGYYLQTKINHDWASGIVFLYDKNYFCEYLPLLTRMVNVFALYTEALTELRTELKTLQAQSEGKIIVFPKERATKRRAA